MSLCPHCENYLPARTFRRHRFLYFKHDSNTWERDPDLGSSSNDDSDEYMQIDNDNFSPPSSPLFHDHSDSDVDEDLGLLDQEIWDEVLPNEIDEDFSGNTNLPSVEANQPQSRSYRTLLNCLLILLAYFWTFFPVPDNAMDFLLLSLKRFFETLAFTNHWFTAFSIAFPGSLYLFQREIGLTGDKFTKYVVCPNCSSVYTFEDCYRRVGNRNASKTCTFVRFPNHRQRRMRKPCGATLLKEVTLSDGTTRLYPHKLFCYKSIVETLTQFVKRPGFTERCELWRNREVRSAHRIMCDVFEGRIWKEFQVFNGSSFLASRRNYAFMLNVDWMQPFEHTQYSVGVMYLVLMNLPRSERFKRENVFLVGIISGPNEPRNNINSFLKPLVDELLVLWDEGVMLRHSGSLLVPECFKAALLCVACDMPASRKVCGFTAHNSKHGCPKCNKEFKTGGFGQPTDYSGFEPCRGRNPVEHRQHIEEILQQPTQELRNAKESLYGARYSELLRLPYFDCIRFTIVDPMHNLFLGTAKRMIEIWLEHSILTQADLEHVQNRVDASKVPSNLGRLPFKIAKSFSGFTAEQWKTWVIVFSPFALFGQLPDAHYRCWLKFVKACKILCQPMIRISDVGIAHDLLVKFCCDVERIYGKERITPNMHMHTHLADCILDYGPIYSFWLFSFERYNGILGNYYTNNNSIELQIMRKFIRDQNIRDFAFPEEYKEQFHDIVNEVDQRTCKSSRIVIDHKLYLDILHLSQNTIDVENKLWYSLAGYSLGSPHVIENLDSDELLYIFEVYKIFFPGISLSNVPSLFDKYASVELASECYGSRFSRLNRFSYVLARWAGRFDGMVDLESTDERPGIVEYFIRQSITYDEHVYSFCFAFVRWFQYHPERFHCGVEGVVPEVWCPSLFESLGPASFVPVQRLSRKFVAGYDNIGGENVLFVMPLERKILV